MSETLLENCHLKHGAESCLYAAIAKELFPSRFGIAFFVKVRPRKSLVVPEC